MKRLSLIITLFLIITVFTSCSTDDNSDITTTSASTTAQTTENAEDIVRIGIDANSLVDPEAFIENVEGYGAEVKDITATGGYLVLFSKQEHENFLKDKKAEVIKKFKDYEKNPEHYVDSIEYDDDFRNLKIYVNKDLYDSTGSTTGNIVVASAALSYQIYLEEGQKVVAKIIYSGTEEVVSTFTLPMNVSLEQ